MRAAAVREVLGHRNLTRHGAHTRLGLSREAVTKLWDGRDVSLETIEGFARALRLNVNEWRERWGYERIEGAGSKRDRFAAWVLEMAERYPHAANLQVALQRGLASLHEISDEEFERMLIENEEIIRAEQDRDANQ